MEQNIVMAVRVAIDRYNGRNEYRAIYDCEGGRRIFRRLKIFATDGAHVQNGKIIIGEPPEKAAEIWNTASVISNKLGDQGAFTEKGRYKFAEVMDEYLEWHDKYKRDTQLRVHAQSAINYFGHKRLNEITRNDVRKWIDTLVVEYADKTISNKVSPPVRLMNWLIFTL